MTVRQRVLEILLELTKNEKISVLLKQDHIFLFHLKKLLLSSAEQGLQRAAQAIIQKLDTQQDLIEVKEKQDVRTNIVNDLAIADNYDILISYSPADRDKCYQIRGQLIKDNFRVRLNLGVRRNSTVKINTDTIEHSEVKYV
jgi:hypothetical protein